MFVKDRTKPRFRGRTKIRQLYRRIEMCKGLLGDHAEQCASIARIAVELCRDGVRPDVEPQGKYVAIYVYR